MKNYEGLTPQQRDDFANAKTLAWTASAAFDQRRNAATDLAEMDMLDSEFYPKDNVTRANRLEADFEQAEARYKLRQRMADVLMPPRVVFDAAIEATETEAKSLESLATPETWTAMTPEQQTTARELRTAIASGPLAEYGVTEDSLRIVGYETDDGEQHFGLIHTGPGIDIGDPDKDFDPARSYRSVMSPANDHLFQLEVNGVTYDSRSGMTDPVYAAKVEDAHRRGVTLPDSQELSEQTGDLWTWTMLSGEKLTAGGDVPRRIVGEGRVLGRAYPPERGGRALRVCPAIKLPAVPAKPGKHTTRYPSDLDD